MKARCFNYYQQEREQLSELEIDKMLQSGRRWDVGPTLANGGVAIFGHAYLQECGPQIASVVHGALDSGADQVVVLGVLHSIPEEFVKARARERAHEALDDIPFRCVHGPLGAASGYWEDEYSLLSFAFLWNEEIKRRGIKKAPKLLFRFPYLVNRKPQSLPGINELEAVCRDSCVVATGDFCHHGVAYGMQKESVLTAKAAHKYARESIQKNLEIMCTGDYENYYEHCMAIRSDTFDIGPIIHHIKGPLRPRLVDLKLCDVSPLYQNHPTPSWVSCTLIELASSSSRALPLPVIDHIT